MLSLILVLLIYVSSISAQLTLEPVEINETVWVTMDNGEDYYGVIISQDEKNIVLKTKVAQITLKSESVKLITPFNYSGKYIFPQRFYSKYFFGPNAIQLKKGEGYYQNTEVVLNSVNYGITDHISIHAGAEFITSVLIGSAIYFASTKAGFGLTEQSYLTGGLLLVKIPDQELTLFSYGAISFGSNDSNISLGGGYATINSQFRESPVIYLAGMQRIGKKFALLTENYFLPITNTTNLLVGIQGFRYFKNRNAFDFGALLSIETDLNFVGYLNGALPYISYSRFF